MSLVFFIFALGTIVGSFLNVVILRHNTGESIIKLGSRCFICGKKLRWYELVPIFSFIIQRGKCRNCKSKISIQYPLVELLTGILFLLTFLKLQNTGYWLLTTGYYFIIFSLLIIIAVYDLCHQIIPNKFVYLFDFLVFLALFRNSDLEIRNLIDWNGFLAGLIFFCFFASLWLFSKGKWMGLGDAKISLGIGWLLGLNKGIFALLLSFWIGGLVGIFLMFFYSKRYNIKSRIAFGPFLVLGTLIAFFLGDAIIKLIL